MSLAAGIAFMAPGGVTLFLRRSGAGDHPGEWDLPGGGSIDGEEPEATAKREAQEEIGEHPHGDLRVQARLLSAEGVDFSTFVMPVEREFVPTLNDEHSEFIWAPASTPPEPLHPGVRAALHTIAMDRGLVDRMAFDRGSVRSYDVDGRLRVEITNISKANVCPYLGSEIPLSEEMGLTPDRIYYLLRDPAELEKAAASFNNLPLLSEHVRVSAGDHKPELVVGATGSDAVYQAPYLRNSLVIWAQDAIDDIENGNARELSCAYRYRADMTPGVYKGTRYDGVMRDIRGNHVALVEDGRAGSDVIVGDSQPKKDGLEMNKQPLSRKAMLAKGALLAFLPQMLATDAKPKFLVKLDALLQGVAADNFKAKKAGMVAAIKPMLAADADIHDVVRLLDTLDGVGEQADAPMSHDPANDEGLTEDEEMQYQDLLARRKKEEPAKDGDPDAKLEGAREEKEPKHGQDEPPPFPGKPADPKGSKVDKGAMDAAIAKAVKDAETNTVKRMTARAEAVAVVKPYVGEVSLALDSAEAVYKFALDTMGIKVEGVHPDAFRPIIEARPKPGEGRGAPVVAMDASGAADFAKRYPAAARIQNLG